MLNEKIEFLMETRLKELSPELHQKYKNCFVTMTEMLEHYTSNFPTYTDHSVHHSLNVIRFCNYIIGEENIGKMNAEEIFILMMGIFLHDSGMGIAPKDYKQYMEENPEVAKVLSNNDELDIIRLIHHELSGFFVKKYAPLFEIGDESYIFAVSQIARGHRKTNLLDEKEYPVEYKLSNGQTICLPYLAALIRLADEIDVGKDRNFDESYKRAEDFNRISFTEFKRHEAIKSVDVEDDSFTLKVEGPVEIVRDIRENALKMQDTLDRCRTAVNGRTKFNVKQAEIKVKEMN